MRAFWTRVTDLDRATQNERSNSLEEFYQIRYRAENSDVALTAGFAASGDGSEILEVSGKPISMCAFLLSVAINDFMLPSRVHPENDTDYHYAKKLLPKGTRIYYDGRQIMAKGFS